MAAVGRLFSRWSSSSRLLLVGSAVGAAAIASTEDPYSNLKIGTSVTIRLIRGAFAASLIAFDYEYSMWGLAEESKERAQAKREAHVRCAQRLRDLCFDNGGIYIKLGQHIGQLEYLVPEEYVQIMRSSMLNRCPVSSYEQVCEVFAKELGRDPKEIFVEFDPIPLASASLAQVHAARTHDGKKVAVKVQHTHLTDTAAIDTVMVDLIVNFLNWCFPAFDYRWLVDEIRESLPKELDFLYEAKNSEKCLENFKRFSPNLAEYVYAPKVYWNLSTSKLLTMEFMDAAEITDVTEIQRLGIHPNDVAKLVSQVFAEMIFKHGFVHCDPHSANMMVRPSNKRSFLGRRKPQLVLLDHGLYKTLDFPTRINYAALWKALIFADIKGIKENSVKLGSGEDLYTLFAGILTMRPWNRVIDPAVDHLFLQGNESDRVELQVVTLKRFDVFDDPFRGPVIPINTLVREIQISAQPSVETGYRTMMYASQYFVQISELLRRLPRVILLMLKTNDCLRAVNNSLGSSLDTFLIVGRISSEAVLETKLLQNKSFLSKICIMAEEILLEVRLLTLHIASWLFQLRRSLSG